MPRLDGITILFYQKYLSTIKEDVIVVKYYFQQGYLLGNESYIHFPTPKRKDNLKMVGHFRLIRTRLSVMPKLIA